MRTISRSIWVFLLLQGWIGSIAAQDKPSDFVRQLPEIFTAVCSASHADMQAYSEKLGIFFRTVQAELDSLAALKITSRSGIGIKANANTAELVKELDKTKKTICKTDYALKFGAALHNEAKKVMEQKLAEINTRMAVSSDYRVIESLLAEIKQVKVDFCNASSPHCIGLLLEQRSTLEKDISAIVTANDLAQRIDCATLGCIYFPALSYENAYLHILDHLNNMFLLLSFFPGND